MTYLNKFLIALCALPLATASLGAASPKQIPVATEDGVLFEVKSPHNRTIYIASSFNNWADNNEGEVSDDRYALERGKNGIWSKVFKLEPGRYTFKLVEEREAFDYWFIPDDMPVVDEEGNAVFTVAANGDVYLGDGINKALSPKVDGNRVTFQVWAPDAGMIYLAGEFNNWAENDEGFVSMVGAQMQGPDDDGIWRKTVDLFSGKYHYQFVIDGQHWIRDPNEQEFLDNHSIVSVD
ncbi:hypothetical protein [Rubellicoccus peritrichatus]|uniref:AMP-activated protein kinase glycogen-binding domain-containing protein n=1 Tax=Rubellicoccus peritrichatus TaxID=3080537 RepID=A0AAQ3LDX9_9BACT|nr:hypothetical protein [Puniceicoccus sp. CR14]WOO41788.1 hypothetical protein RZN69_01715 [Puniceicoccus sp. CR14]